MRAEPLHLLEADPDLGGPLEARRFEEARATLLASALTLPPGEWQPAEGPGAGSGDLGVLVVEGLLARDVAIAETSCAELVGRGDLLRPWDDPAIAAALPSEVEWLVLSPTRVAVLDAEFVKRAALFPEVMAELVARGVRRAQTLAIALAISCITGLELRLLALLWHLADRFGRVGPEGTSVPIPLTHALIARMVGATRPSVSSSLKALEREGRLKRLRDGGFVLHGEPPEVAKLLTNRRRAS